MLLSVIIPTHNRAGMVCRAVDSVLRQSFRDFELIVVDDGSTDDTLHWLMRYDDERLHIITKAKQGVASARNTGARAAKGDWLCFLDSDDVWHRHKLSEQIRLHARSPEILFSHTEELWIRNSVRVNKPKKYSATPGDAFKKSLDLCWISASSVMLHQTIFWQANGFAENFSACEDYDLWLKLTARYQVGCIVKPLVTKFAGHKDQLSKTTPLLDQYRVQAIENLLQQHSLTTEQIAWAKEALNKKRKIIELGRGKRANH